MRVAFIMEQHIGHRTFYENLRCYASVDPRIESRWVEVNYFQEDGWIETSRLIPSGIKGPLRGFLQSRKGLNASPVDAAFFNTQIPAVFTMDRMKNIPTIISTDITPMQYDRIAKVYGHKPDKSGLVKKIKYRINRSLFNNAAHIIAWSNWVRESLMTDYGVPENRISVIPPGVDMDLWSPAMILNDKPPMKILFVGGDFKRKGGFTLLEAYKILDRSDVELHLVTREEVQKIPGVFIYHHMKANSPELIKLYSQCDIFVLPSLGEAFGIVAVEALACGLPVIASKIGGLMDIIEDGKNGLLIPPGDPIALAMAIRHLVENHDLHMNMRYAARKSAEDRFDAQKNSDKCVGLILEHARSNDAA